MQLDKRQMRFGLVILGLVVVYVAGLWWPQQRQISATQNQIAEFEQQLGLTKGRTDGLSILAGEVDELRRMIATNNKEIPEHAELATVLREISLQIETMQLTGQGISTRPTVEKDDYVILPVDLTFRGGSTSVFRFINEIESMRRLTQVESIEVIKSIDTPGEVQANVKLMTYFSQSEGGKS